MINMLRTWVSGAGHATNTTRLYSCRSFTVPHSSQSIRNLATFTNHTKPSHTYLPRSPWRTTHKRAEQIRSYRQQFNYQRFQTNRDILRRWAQHPHFYYHIAGIGIVCGGFYVYNLEDVPVSHRRRFRIVSYASEAALGQNMYQQTLQEYSGQLLPPSHSYYQMVQRVARRLIPHSGLQDEKWEMNVIQSPEKNAFVVPGGKIFVFTGMFDVCKTDDSLAAVIGHEIAHNVAHHAAERASSGVLVMLGGLVISLLIGSDLGQNMLLDLMFTRPGSRTQESEADYIGLLMMAEACYDPHAAMDMWATMEKIDQNSPPQWISTHPSNHNRLEKIREWLPQAEDKMQQSGCAAIRPQAEQFWKQHLAYR